MTWAARLTHTPTGLALTFGEPVSRLDMAPDVAQHLASLLAVEERHRMRGVVAELDDHQSAVLPGNPEQSRSVRLIGGHPLCCDCEPSLNGDHDG